MGEAKRRKAVTANGPCACGSGKVAAQCCFQSGFWHKAPSPIALIDTDHTERNVHCYLEFLVACSPKVSREHLVSEAVLKVIQKDRLVVSGFPWLPQGEERVVGKGSLVAKCLCQAHNSALSHLDAAAAKFFATIEASDLARSGLPQHHLLSGHDIERWFLKTLLGMANSQNLAHDGKPLAPLFHPKINLVGMLEHPSSWPDGAGLYSTRRLGEEFLRGDHFWLAPLTKPNTGEIVGMLAEVQGLSFSFLAAPPDNIQRAISDGNIYRPGKLKFRIGASTNVVELSWEDRHSHGYLEMTLVSTKGERLASGNKLPENAN